RYLTDLGDLDTAQRVYEALAARDVNNVPELAAFLGLHRDVAQCFAKLQEVYTPERIPALLQVAMPVIRQRRAQIGDKFDAQLQTWIEAGLRNNPDSMPLRVVQADLFDLQKRYDDAAKVYRELLSRKDVTGMPRAVVLNNLAFLAALSGSASEVDPLKLVND